jgi:hypothetical protein
MTLSIIGMTEKRLAEIEAEGLALAAEATLIIHRVGRLLPSAHRSGRHRLFPSPGGAGELPVPDRLVEDQGAILEIGGDAERR